MHIKITLVAATMGAMALTTAAAAGPRAQEATPTAMASCEGTAPPSAMGTPGSMMGGMEMGMGTPMAGMDHAAMGLDLVYIDMMIPHHASIVAMAQASLPRLEDERLREIAQEIVAAQQAEVGELRAMREAISGEADPMPVDDAMMAAMDELMPGMSGSMKEMAFQMDATAQVAAICAAKNTDVAFIELTIPHHRMAIEASDVVAEQSESAELRDFAQRVIAAQQQEIDALTAIGNELAGVATPSTAVNQRPHDVLHHGDSAPTEGAAGEEVRALAPDVITQIQRGDGAGLALPAERNGVPGPRHVLDLAAELGLSAEQRTAVQSISDAMQTAAIPAGERFLAAQGALEADFRSGAIDVESLPARVAEVSQLHGELVTIHLAAHVRIAAVLTPDQVAAYADPRLVG